MIKYRSGNPALTSKTFQNLDVSGQGVMTLDGTVNKISISLFILLASAFYSFSNQDTTFIWLGIIGGFVLALVTIFKKEWSPYTVPMYAVLEGLALGGISVIYEHMYTGIVQQAIFLTFGIFGALLFAYKSQIISPTENFKLGIFAATGGIALFYFISIILGLFGVDVSILNPTNGGLMSIGFSIFVRLSI